MIEVFFDFGPHKANDYVSELAATDQLLSPFLRATDLASAVAIGLAVCLVFRGHGVLRDHRIRGWLPVIAWGAVGLFAVATALDSAWPLTCAPHADEACAVREAAGAVPLTHQLHTFSSAAAGGAALLSLGAFVRLDAQEPAGSRMRRSGRWILGALVVTTVWTVIGVMLDYFHVLVALGIAQRLELVCVAAWLVYLAARLRVASRLTDRTAAYGP
jgi:hypothetical protein